MVITCYIQRTNPGYWWFMNVSGPDGKRAEAYGCQSASSAYIQTPLAESPNSCVQPQLPCPPTWPVCTPEMHEQFQVQRPPLRDFVQVQPSFNGLAATGIIWVPGALLLLLRPCLPPRRLRPQGELLRKRCWVRLSSANNSPSN